MRAAGSAFFFCKDYKFRGVLGSYERRAVDYLYVHQSFELNAFIIVSGSSILFVSVRDTVSDMGRESWFYQDLL